MNKNVICVSEEDVYKSRYVTFLCEVICMYVCVCVFDQNLPPRVCSHTHIHTAAKGQWGECALQLNWLRATIQELCGMCPRAASDWNLHLWNNCGTQSAVVYCHSRSESSAGRYAGGSRKSERGRAERRRSPRPKAQLTLLRCLT